MSNWPIVALSDVATFSCGGTPSKAQDAFWNGDIPWISPKDMKSNHIEDAEDKITRDAVASSAAKIVGCDSVLAVVRSGILAHSFPVATIGRDVSFNQDIKAITPKNGALLPQFLFWMLKSREAEIIRIGVKKGATVHSLSNGFLDALRFALPPLDEQWRIVGLLDRAAEIRRRTETARVRARAVIPALFFDTFGDPATNPKGWPTVPFAEIVQSFRYGTNQKCRDEEIDGAIPVLRIPNVIGARIDWRDLKFAVLPNNEMQKLQLSRGDLLFVRTNGNPEYIGRCAEYQDERRAAYASYLIRARLSDSMSPTFVCQHFTHSNYRPTVLRAGRTTAGNYNLSIEGLGKLPLITPPLALQTAFAEQVNRIEALTHALDAAASKTGAMAASLSSEVFRE